jgi:hypothetical protein
MNGQKTTSDAKFRRSPLGYALSPDLTSANARPSLLRMGLMARFPSPENHSSNEERAFSQNCTPLAPRPKPVDNDEGRPRGRPSGSRSASGGALSGLTFRSASIAGAGFEPATFGL